MKRINYTLTEEQKADILEDFITKLNEPWPSANISYKTKIEDEALTNESKATLIIEAAAYAKMMMYIRDTDTEIAWHGKAYRADDGTSKYYIEDVFLYPQIVRAATVDTDQEKYQNWLTNLDDETFNNLRFQGHSHVNMGVSPSSVDTAYYDTILDTYKKEAPDSFYIFTIMNKRGEMYLLIYDLAKNIIYSKEDIDVYIRNENLDISAQIKEQKKQFCEVPAPITYIPPKPYCPDNFGYVNIQEDKIDKILNKYAQDEYPSETDKIYNDLDKKYKNYHLSAGTKKHKKK